MPSSRHFEKILHVFIETFCKNTSCIHAPKKKFKKKNCTQKKFQKKFPKKISHPKKLKFFFFAKFFLHIENIHTLREKEFRPWHLLNFWTLAPS